MKKTVVPTFRSAHIPAALVLLAFVSTPVYAQLPGGWNKRIEQAKGVKAKVDKVVVSDKEERQLGDEVSAKLRQDFGVFQDKEVTKYVSLVGHVLAAGSSRPGLDWQFIVLDTDGVNAFAAPGGIVHITRGALGLIKNEAELAGVLGHEITHVTAKHTVNSVQKNSALKLGEDQVGSSGLTASVISKLAAAAYSDVINNKFDRNDEVAADKGGIALANKAGYAPGALSQVLGRIAERNKDQKEPNGMFASHPLIKDRQENIATAINEDKLAAKAIVAARYTKYITFDAKPIGEVAVIAGTRGLTSGEASKDAKDAKNEEPKKEEPKKNKGLLGKAGLTGGSQAQNTQTVASAGARGIEPDRDAKGGSNPNKVPVTISASELADFRKNIV